jgi:hypothetical protein
MTKHELAALAKAALENGAKVTILRENATCGLTNRDWRQAVRSEAPKAARPVMLEQFEEMRREMIHDAQHSGDYELVNDILNGKLDASIEERARKGY